MRYQINIQGLSEVDVIKILKKIERQYKGVLWYSQKMRGAHKDKSLIERYKLIGDKATYLIYESVENYLLRSSEFYMNYSELKLTDNIQTKLK